MIEAEHLTKSYGGFTAVRDLSFRVDRGEIVGFLGPNGAGKSTTLRILAGFLGATSGTVRIAGHDIGRDSAAARAKIGYMPETSPLYPEMRVAEYLRFRAELKLIPRARRKEAVSRALHDARVDDMADVMIGHLSKGYRQRVGLADALVASPPLLILDEPTAGLDPNQIREVRALIRRLGEEHTVLLSTHILSEVEATCGRAIVIANGRLVAEGSIERIRNMRRSAEMSLRVRGAAERALSLTRAVAGVREATEAAAEAAGESLLTVRFDSTADGPGVTEAIVSALVGDGLGVREVTPKAASLEQIFSELTTTRDAAGEGGEGGEGEGVGEGGGGGVAP
jgi:ABC-2 type transport system ATP-binding protein